MKFLQPVLIGLGVAILGGLLYAIGYSDGFILGVGYAKAHAPAIIPAVEIVEEEKSHETD
jgi:hypothetical protein